MTTAEQTVEEVWESLAAHFRRSADPLSPEQVMEMTAFGQEAVNNALAVLYNNHQIEGHTVWGEAHPVIITRVIYE